MREMTAFERQIAMRLEQMAGPDPSVDVMASVRAATTTAPKVRVRGMFSATKLVMASITVALFGGVLLAGVLTQPRGESGPAVGASASPSPQTTDVLLSRVETEEVVPGVLKVIGDGTPGRDLNQVTMTVANEDGTVWMSARSSIIELGQAERQRGRAGWLAFATDGTMWAVDPGDPYHSIASFDGETWTERGDSPYDPAARPDPWWPADFITDFAVHPDGTVWWAAGKEGSNKPSSLQHLGPAGWTSLAIGDGLPGPNPCGDCGDDGNWSVVITPDGTVWVGTSRHGLIRSDGNEWEVMKPLGDDQPYGVLSLAANADGILWAEVQTKDTSALEWGPFRLGQDRHLARFDGEEWQVFYPAGTPDFLQESDLSYRGPGGIEAVGPDGTVWLTDTYPDPETRGGRFPVSFDGERWRRYPEIVEQWASDPVFNLEKCCQGPWHITTAPNGDAWVNIDASRGNNSHGGVYVITPLATAPTKSS